MRGLVLFLAGALICSGVLAAQSPAWVTAWSTSQQTLGDARITNATVRMIARVTVSGSAVRIRLDNAFGAEPLSIGRASVGPRIRNSELARGSNRPLTFGGVSAVVISPGGTVWSDPVALKVFAQQDLAVSLYIPGTNVRPSQHTAAFVTSYRSADGSGDVASDEAGDAFKETTRSLWWLKAIDVQSADAPGAIVAFGDSITDGSCSTLDAHDRWEDVVSVRLDGRKAIVNEGIGGNTVTREGLTPPADSPTGIERLERDVLSHHGVTDVVVFMGTNDIRRGATAATVIAGLTSIVKRIKAKNIHAIGVTIIPRHKVAPSGTNTGWDSGKTRIRNEVNQWIRSKALFDDVIDFTQVVRDPGDADVLYPPFNCDGIHPSAAGYYQMGKSVDLKVFR
jgi:lysophospholipase L1-like esterase